MAQGTQRAADSVGLQTGKTIHDWDAAGDQFTVALVSDTYAASEAFTNISQFTKVTGGSYADNNVTKTFTRSDETSTLQVANTSWAQDGAGPTDIRCAVLFNSDAGAVGQDDVISVIDLTADGTTPISLQTGALNINFSTSPTLQITSTPSV